MPRRRRDGAVVASVPARGAIALLLAGLGLVVACAVESRRAPAAAAPEAQRCLGLEREACRADSACEAVPYWGESFAPCQTDERGFASNCPFEGCRPAGADCPDLDALAARCPTSCGYNDFAIDPATGCRICDCRSAPSPAPRGG